MRNTFGGVLLLSLVLSSNAAFGEEPAASSPKPRPSEGFLLGDDYRYGNMMMPLRVAADLIAIPANAGLWSQAEWGLFLATSTAVVGMMVPFENSPDVLLQRWVKTFGVWRHYVWTPVTEVVVWGAIVASMGALYFNGEQELISLMAESFAVAQLYQFIFKLSLGREGPMNGEGLGVIHGPSASLGLFPAGTPSGHAASFFALIGAFNAYRASPTISGILLGVGLLFSASLVVSDYHFISDVVWGAIMGFSIGHWVVKHRAAVGEPRRPIDLLSSVAPMVRKEQDQWTFGVVGRF